MPENDTYRRFEIHSRSLRIFDFGAGDNPSQLFELCPLFQLTSVTFDPALPYIPYHRGASSNQRAARETAKISSAQSKNAREYWQQPTLSSEDGQLAKTANGIVPD